MKNSRSLLQGVIDEKIYEFERKIFDDRNFLINNSSD